MSFYNKILGALGERYASRYLFEKGYKILLHNFTSRWGELDIIAEKANKLIFIEVKARVSSTQGAPYEAITKGKISRLHRTIQYFLLGHPEYKNYKYSLDAISIHLNPDNSLKKLSHYESLEIP